MKKSTKIVLSLVASTMLFTGCGGGASDPASGNPTTDNNPNKQVTIEKNAKAQLGVLSDAMVKIYELGNSSKKLLFTEITTAGKTIEDIGNFNAHEKELKNDKFYLYEVHGGNDWDVDDDGVVDANPTLNEGILRAVIKGSTVKSIGGKFKVTAISEILYQKVEEHIDTPAVLESKIKESTERIIDADLNSDGKIDEKDILEFNPITHEDKLKTEYKDKLEKIVNDIHDKKEIDITVPPIIVGDTFVIAQNATSGNIVGSIHVEDDGEGNITEFRLSGTGSEKFTIDAQGVIKVSGLGTLAHEIVSRYELTAIAKNSAGDSNAVTININVTKVDMQAPVFTSSDSITINENSLLSHKLETTDSSSVTYTIDGGTDADLFSVDTNGVLSSNTVFDYEDTHHDKSYEVKIKAEDSAGNIAYQTITISVTNAADEVPILKNMTFDVIENLPDGNVLGKVEVEKVGDSAISKYELSGVGSENFTISGNGVISIVEGTKLEPRYEEQRIGLSNVTVHVPSFSINVTATNEAGVSESITADIKVFEGTYITYTGDNNISFNENEIPPDIKLSAVSALGSPLRFSLLDYESIPGTYGKFKKIYVDETSTAYLERGYLKFKDIIEEGGHNYETIIAIHDDYNHTLEVTISLPVINIPDIAPRLEGGGYVGRINEKRIDSSVTQANHLGTIETYAGDSPITEYTLTGYGSEYFHIDFDGNISIKNSIPENAYSFDLVAKAKNIVGDSNEVRVLLNIADTDPNVVGTVILSPKALERQPRTTGSLYMGDYETAPYVAILANAQVSLFEVDSEGILTKVEDFNETTSGGSYLQAGHFNTHSEDLTYKTNYMYKVEGGGFLYFDKLGNPIEKDLEYEKSTLIRNNTGELYTYIKGGEFRALKDGHFNITSKRNSWENPMSPDWKDWDWKTGSLYHGNSAVVADMLVDRNGTLPIYDSNPGNLWLSSDGKTMVLKSGIIDLTNPLFPHINFFVGPRVDLDGAISNDGIRNYSIQSLEYDVGDAGSGIDKSAIGKTNDSSYALKITDISNKDKTKDTRYVGNDMFKYGQKIILSNDEKTIILVSPSWASEHVLKVVDISDFDNPRLKGALETTSPMAQLVFSDDESLVYVANKEDGLAIIDMSADEPTFKTSIDTHDANDVVLSSDGTKAYIADGSEGLKIIDIKNPNSLTVLGTVDTESAIAVTLSPDGLTAFISDFEAGLKIIDVSNPQAPKIIGTYEGKIIKKVKISPDGKYAYLNVVSNYNGIKMAYDTNSFKAIEISQYLNATE